MSQVVLAAIAVVLGLLVGIVLFVPLVAVAYRRRGRVTPRESLLTASAVVYFVAIWVYTLLPLPDSNAFACAPPNLDVLAFVGDLRGALGRGRLLTDVAFLQLALNVLLFVPLGVLIRVGLRRGVLVAFGAGLVVSLLIETTQITGVWGLYPCAYRVFDVDDLLMNTLGAVVGSILALAVPRRWRVPPAHAAEAARPRPVTRSRRLLAFLCDLLFVTLLSFGVVLAIVLGNALLGGDPALGGASWVAWAGVLVPLAVTAAVTLSTGRSIGQLAVELRYVDSPYPTAVSRALVFVAGIGGYQIVGSLPEGWSALGTTVFVVVSVVMVFTTRGARGLPGVAARATLADARVSAPGADRTR